MSGRILSHRLVPLMRTGLLARHVHHAGARTGGLLRADGSAALRGRTWPVGANSIHNNVPAVRAISFSRMLPKLAVKLARLPALFGGTMLAGAAYFQYQATRMCPCMVPGRVWGLCRSLLRSHRRLLDGGCRAAGGSRRIVLGLNGSVL